MVLGTAFGCGYTLGPFLASGLGVGVGAALPIALAADTISIATIELMDTLVVVLVPGATDAGLSTVLFWASLAASLAVAFVVTVPVNRWLISRGRGHAVVHQLNHSA